MSAFQDDGAGARSILVETPYAPVITLATLATIIQTLIFVGKAGALHIRMAVNMQTATTMSFTFKSAPRPTDAFKDLFIATPDDAGTPDPAKRIYLKPTHDFRVANVGAGAQFIDFLVLVPAQQYLQLLGSSNNGAAQISSLLILAGHN